MCREPTRSTWLWRTDWTGLGCQDETWRSWVEGNRMLSGRPDSGRTRLILGPAGQGDFPARAG